MSVDAIQANDVYGDYLDCLTSGGDPQPASSTAKFAKYAYLMAQHV